MPIMDVRSAQSRVLGPCADSSPLAEPLNDCLRTLVMRAEQLPSLVHSSLGALGRVRERCERAVAAAQLKGRTSVAIHAERP